jgi:putative MATE family efflux protein
MQKINVRKLFVKYVSLNMVGMIGLSCYILADTFFVARGVGANGLAALNLAIPAYSFINGTGLMIGMGGAIRFSLSKENQVFTQSIYYILLAACVFWTLSFFSEPLAHLLGANSETMQYTSVYLKTILCFSPLFLLNNCIICFVRNDKNPTLAMTAMIMGSLWNIVMDYVFIFPCGMEMFGAALATGFSPVISLIILSAHFIKKKNTFSLSRHIPKLHALVDITALGASSLITEISSGIVIIVFNIIILRIAQNTGVAAYGIIVNIALVVLSVFTGISQGIQPIVSSCIGSEDKHGARLALVYGVFVSIFIAAAIYTVTFIFADPIVDIFNRDNDVVLSEMAENGLKIYFTSFIFSGINILCAAFLSAADKPKRAIAVSFLRGFIIIIPAVIILAILFGINGVWISMTVTEFIVVLFSLKMMRKVL